MYARFKQRSDKGQGGERGREGTLFFKSYLSSYLNKGKFDFDVSTKIYIQGVDSLPVYPTNPFF